MSLSNATDHEDHHHQHPHQPHHPLHGNSEHEHENDPIEEEEGLEESHLLEEINLTESTQPSAPVTSRLIKPRLRHPGDDGVRSKKNRMFSDHFELDKSDHIRLPSHDRVSWEQRRKGGVVELKEKEEEEKEFKGKLESAELRP